MQILVDTDPFIYSIACAAQPNCYWVEGRDFNTKKEAKEFCKKKDIDPASIEKEAFLFSPRYVRQFIKSTLRGVIPGCEESLRAEMGRDPEIEYIDWYISSKTNSRKGIDPDYKGTRPPPPRWRDFVRDELCVLKEPEIIEGLEADDLVAKYQWTAWKQQYPSCIISIDKDLTNIPGWHYNPNKKVAYHTTPYESFQTFMGQFLTGDSSDNIPGIKGIGPVKAKKLLPEFEDHFGLYPEIFRRFKTSTVALYADHFDKPEQRFDMNFSLLDVGGVWAEILGVEHLLKELKEIR